MPRSYSNQISDQPYQPEKGWIESLLNFPMTPYVLGVIVWMLAWWVQMGPARPLFNFAPGVELPFFPAGVRTLAVFIFGMPGSLAGLTFRNVSWIVITQSILSATLHQVLYHSEQISQTYAEESLSTMLFNWAAMATGDALGSMSVIFVVLIGHQLYTHKN